MSSRSLLALVVLADIAIVFGGTRLEEFSLRSAFDPSSSALLILALLAANLVLLGIVGLAVAASSMLLYRLVKCVR
jgi:hypothetical protein